MGNVNSPCTLTIVVIDDSRDMVASLKILIGYDGHNVEGALTAEGGIELVKTMRPDLVICDINLKGQINGYGVARTVRLNRDLANTFMISLSGNDQAEDRARSAKAGFNAHVGKPIRYARIRELMHDAVCHKNAHTPL